MWLGVFQLAGEQVEVVIRGNEVLFRDTQTQMITSIEGLRLSKAGILKEFPDLKNNNEWKKVAIERWKEHIKKFEKEEDKLFYIKDELEKQGYEPKYYQRGGHRPKKF